MIGKWLRRRANDKDEELINYAIGSGNWKYILVSMKDVDSIVRNTGTSPDHCDEIRIKRGAEITLLLDYKEGE